MKIYTRTGDDGTTSLAGGERVHKAHLQIEAYGTVDELISWVGLLRSLPENSERTQILEKVQDSLMHCAAILSSGKNALVERMKAPGKESVELLEKEIDLMESELAPLDSFILPGGNMASSYANIARTVCRRAERSVIRFGESASVDNRVVKYINRLSDYLFVLGRIISRENNSPETRWIT